MKRISLVCAMGLTASLAACGGGGGGGGGGSVSSGGNAAFSYRDWAGDATERTAPAMSNADQTASALMPSVERQSLKDGISIGYYGYTIKAESDGSVSLKDGGTLLSTFAASDAKFFTKDGIDFAVMQKSYKTNPTDGYWVKNVTATDSMWVGG